MATVSPYPTANLPSALRCQLLSLMRAEWPEGYSGARQFRDEVSPEGESENTVHLVIEERGFLVAHAGVVWRNVEHGARSWVTGGLTGVLTFPDFRHLGFGTQVVEAATRHMKELGADIGLATCDPELRSFYERAGWTPMEGAILAYGDADTPRQVDELVIMAFLGRDAQGRRAAFEGQSIFVGKHPW